MKWTKVAAVTAISLLYSVGAIAQVAPDPLFTPVELPQLEHHDASLSIIDSSGATHVYAPADLEGLPTYMVETLTPWRDAPARFEGILLADLLSRHGLADAERIHVVAENDFVSEIERAVWQSGAIMIATRVNGAAHTRRSRGPIQFIIPMDRFDNDDLFTAQHLVWMAAEIRLAD